MICDDFEAPHPLNVRKVINIQEEAESLRIGPVGLGTRENTTCVKLAAVFDSFVTLFLTSSTVQFHNSSSM